MSEARHPSFISWVDYHGRSADLADLFGMNSLFVARRQGSAMLHYLLAAIKTIQHIARYRPPVVFVMQPPIPALLIAWIYALLFRRRLVGDLHSGTFNSRRWSWSSRLCLLLLKGRHLALITNTDHAAACAAHGVSHLVLHDVIRYEAGINDETREDGHGQILVPLSYAADEPVDEVIAAAAATPQVEWLLTGRPPKQLAQDTSLPANVTLSGYLTFEQYREALASSLLVVALTTRESTMQRAAYEAMCSGVPLVTSPTRVLRDFYGNAAEYAGPSAHEIRDAVCRVLLDRTAYRKRILTRLSGAVVEQRGVLSELANWIAGDATSAGDVAC